jgi:hypothetical protein
LHVQRTLGKKELVPCERFDLEVEAESIIEKGGRWERGSTRERERNTGWRGRWRDGGREKMEKLKSLDLTHQYARWFTSPPLLLEFLFFFVFVFAVKQTTFAFGRSRVKKSNVRGT